MPLLVLNCVLLSISFCFTFLNFGYESTERLITKEVGTKMVRVGVNLRENTKEFVKLTSVRFNLHGNHVVPNCTFGFYNFQYLYAHHPLLFKIEKISLNYKSKMFLSWVENQRISSRSDCWKNLNYWQTRGRVTFWIWGNFRCAKCKHKAISRLVKIPFSFHENPFFFFFIFH